MTLYYSAEAITTVVTPALALEAATIGLTAEAAGTAALPSRVDTRSAHGFIRVMPGVLDDVMGLKVMTLVEGIGTRYLVLMYGTSTGELLALFDADQLTALRTAAVTAVAGRHLVAEEPEVIGLIGTGFEARNHLRTFASMWPLRQVVVWSRSELNRARFAKALAAELRIVVRAATTSAEASASVPVVVLATKSTTPVVDGNDFDPKTVVLSIGSTRPDLRELDRATLARTGTLVVDHRDQVLAESGDVIEALETNALSRDNIVSLADVISDAGLAHLRDRDLITFKSVGTALQDLALAREVHRRSTGHGRELGELTGLKPFASKGPG